MKKYKAKLICLVLVFLSVFYIQNITLQNLTLANEVKIEVIYFYTNVCDSCNVAEQLLEDFYNKVDEYEIDAEVNLRLYNIYEEYYYDLLMLYFEKYEVPEEEQHDPIVFIGDHFYYDDNIEKGLNIELKEIKSGHYPETRVYALNSNQADNALKRFSTTNVLKVISVGVINGFNPCSISMLLFLFSLLMVSKKTFLKMGISFLVGKYVSYFLLGTLLFSLIQSINMNAYQLVSKIVIGLFSLLLCLFYLRDYVFAKKEDYSKIRMQLPSFLRKFNHNMIKKFTDRDSFALAIPSGLLLGIIISIGEFFCTGQLFLASILLVMRTEANMVGKAFSYLFLYNTGFILPLAILMILLYKGQESFVISEGIRKRLPLIKILTAIVFLMIAGYIIFFT